MPALGKVGTDAAGEGVIWFDGFGVVIDEEGFFVVMEDVGCMAGDTDAKVGVLVLRFFIVPIKPCPLDVVGVAALGSVGDAIDEDGTIPFEGRATEGILASGVIRGLNEGDCAIP